QQVIRGRAGSLAEWGVAYEEVPLRPDQTVDVEAVARAVQKPDARCLFIQRSRGYSLRAPLTVAEIGEIIRAAREANPGITVLVDNCYGEFVEAQEPPHVGADLTCGSLIKNPGGGIAPTGGYIVGRADLVERA